jgi:hypothetical protein
MLVPLSQSASTDAASVATTAAGTSLPVVRRLYEIRLSGVLGGSLPASNAEATARITHLSDVPGGGYLLAWLRCATRCELLSPAV